MNKIKFELLSSSLFDETAIVDISLNNDNVLATDAIIATSGTTLVYDIDNFQDLNYISISIKNGMSVGTIYTTKEFFDEGEITNIVRSTIDLPINEIDDVVLFVYSVSISQDNGTTWEDITFGKELNPQFISFKNYTTNYLHTCIKSKSSTFSTLCFIKETYFGTNKAFVIDGDEFSFYFSKDTSQKYLDDFLIDPTLYQIKKTRGSRPEQYVCTISEENRSSLPNNILDKEENYLQPLYRP